MPGHCERWGEYLTGNARLDEEVQTKGRVCARCRSGLREKGTLSKGVKWFETEVHKPKFKAAHLKQRHRKAVSEQTASATGMDATTASAQTHGLAVPAAGILTTVDDVEKQRFKLKKKGAWEVHTDLNYSKYNAGRTWQQYARTLVPKRMLDGSFKNLIYV